MHSMNIVRLEGQSQRIQVRGYTVRYASSPLYIALVGIEVGMPHPLAEDATELPSCWNGSEACPTPHPLFIVFPAPLGFNSVYRAPFSSFSLFCSPFSSAAAVPSCSAASASSSDSVGASADACLRYLVSPGLVFSQAALTLLQ